MINNDSTIIVKTKTIEWTNDKIAFNTYRLNIKIDQTYPLLYCRGCIKITNNDGTINVETKTNRVNKMTKLHSIHIEFIL